MQEKQTYGNREDRVVFETLLKTGRNKEGSVPRAYLSGIGGIGVSAVAHILLDAGWSVCGADIQASRVTQELGERGAKIYLGHSAENLKYDPVDVAVYSSAVRRDSQDILEIQRQRIPLLHRAEALASILRQYRGICVSGMHGKTTVSSLLVCALNGLGAEPGYAVGGSCRQFDPHARISRTSSHWFVAEADESDGSLLDYFPEYAFILNIDRDHLDYYRSDERIGETFVRFADQVQKQIFCCADNHWVMSLRAQHFADRGVTYGFHPDSDYQAVLKEFLPQGGQSFEVLRHGKSLGDFKIRLMGEHNVCNAAAVIALLTELGYSSRDIADSIKDFTGARRRQELLFSNESYRIIDDYGHHPAEIRATIRAVKRQGGRLLVVFQPHRFSRTQLLLNEFSTCFEGVDQLLLTDVYAASENPIPGVSGECMAQAIRAHGQQVEYLQHLEDVGKAVERISKPGDVILFLGAGDITRQAHQYADGLRKGKAVNE
ncbi:MAG: UDP-N-acetylmuramate--L-alanine ligase [Verrucomicrobia bacterium]|nr:UDP-N-acetylmuramate--L-alanine ligase [Verrucomicrobiota bacterium]